jgi:ubiquinone biosynthesis protein
VISDLASTAMVLARFGPRLPGLVEAALLRQSNEVVVVRRRPFKRWLLLACGVGIVLGILLVLGIEGLG